jgi:large conductance mechanosensitive channel
MRLVNEFKTFILRGNVLELAVAVVIGVAFAALVNAAVADLITPVIAAIFGKPDFATLSFTINHSTFYYGDFFNKLISFVCLAAVVFFLVVVPMNALIAPSKRKCPQCLSEVPVAAHRCAFCTSDLGAAA